MIFTLQWALRVVVVALGLVATVAMLALAVAVAVVNHQELAVKVAKVFAC